MIGPLIEWPFSLLIPFRTVKYEASWRCVSPPMSEPRARLPDWEIEAS